MSNIRPLHDRILVKREAEEEKSSGGIVIPDTANKEKPMIGTVIALGNGKILENGEIRPLDLKVGEKVLFGKYAGTEVKMDEEEFLMMREDDIMGVIS